MDKQITNSADNGHKDLSVSGSYTPGALSSSAIKALSKAKTVTDTSKQYDSHFRLFNRWLTHKGFAGPITSITHVEIINFLADQHQGILTQVSPTSGILEDGHTISLNTLKSRCWGIYKILEVQGNLIAESHKKEVKAFLDMLALTPNEGNKSGRREGQAYPLRWTDVCSMMLSDYIDSSKSSMAKSRDKAILAFLSVSGCRESEAMGAFGVRIKDFTIYDSHIEYKRVVLKNGKRAYDFTGSLEKTGLGKACPYEAIKHHIHKMKSHPLCTPETKLFSRLNKNGNLYISGSPKQIVALQPNMVDSWLRDLAISIGINLDLVQRVSGHSVRMGLVVDQVEKGKSLKYISSITGQSISTVERYAQQAQMGGFKAGQ